MSGLRIEISKNIIFSGPHSVTIFDDNKIKKKTKSLFKFLR